MSMQSDEILLPCPFCGGKAEQGSYPSGSWKVGCYNPGCIAERPQPELTGEAHGRMSVGGSLIERLRDSIRDNSGGHYLTNLAGDTLWWTRNPVNLTKLAIAAMGGTVAGVVANAPGRLDTSSPAELQARINHYDREVKFLIETKHKLWTSKEELLEEVEQFLNWWEVTPCRPAGDEAPGIIELRALVEKHRGKRL